MRPKVCGSFVFVFVLLCTALCSFKFCNHLDKEEKACGFATIVLQMYCYYKCSVSIPHGGMGWPVVCDCSFF